MGGARGRGGHSTRPLASPDKPTPVWHGERPERDLGIQVTRYKLNCALEDAVACMIYTGVDTGFTQGGDKSRRARGGRRGPILEQP